MTASLHTLAERVEAARKAYAAGHAQWTMRETAHLNGGKDWFGYEYQCVQQPRLRRLDRYRRKDRSVTSEWSVDGEKCASFDDALAELECGPCPSVVEMEVIATFTAPTSRKSDFADFAAVSPSLRSLDRKGLVWWEKGSVSLLADAISRALDRAESNASGNPEWEAVSRAVEVARASLRALAAQGEAGASGEAA